MLIEDVIRNVNVASSWVLAGCGAGTPSFLWLFLLTGTPNRLLHGGHCSGRGDFLCFFALLIFLVISQHSLDTSETQSLSRS
jgi:hypothetical protein